MPYEFKALRRVEFSDTEVLLRAYQHWGTQCVLHLQGQFAFALWDARSERLFLARDRFGEKPLYLHQANGALYFASELKALLTLPQIPRDLDLSAVWDYLAYRYVPGPRTLFEAIGKLPPATAAVWHRGQLQETRYWTFREVPARGHIFLERYLDRDYDPRDYVRAEIVFVDGKVASWRTLPRPTY